MLHRAIAGLWTFSEDAATINFINAVGSSVLAASQVFVECHESHVGFWDALSFSFPECVAKGSRLTLGV